MLYIFQPVNMKPIKKILSKHRLAIINFIEKSIDVINIKVVYILQYLNLAFLNDLRQWVHNNRLTPFTHFDQLNRTLTFSWMISYLLTRKFQIMKMFIVFRFYNFRKRISTSNQLIFTLVIFKYQQACCRYYEISIGYSVPSL